LFTTVLVVVAVVVAEFVRTLDPEAVGLPLNPNRDDPCGRIALLRARASVATLLLLWPPPLLPLLAAVLPPPPCEAPKAGMALALNHIGNTHNKKNLFIVIFHLLLGLLSRKN
jgi:hypothetical protein